MVNAAAGINEVLRSILNDIDDVMAVVLMDSSDMVIASVTKQWTKVNQGDLTLLVSLINDSIRRMARLNPGNQLIDPENRVFTISDESTLIVAVSKGGLSLAALCDNFIDVNVIIFRLMNDIESIIKLLNELQPT